jgi:hypothetical protein
VRRRPETIELERGAWLRLDCGHPTPPTRDADGTADCSLCDRGQLPVGLAPIGRPRRLDARWIARHHHRLALTDWSTLTVECGTVDITRYRQRGRSLGVAQRTVLVPGLTYRLEASSDARLTVQAFRRGDMNCDSRTVHHSEGLGQTPRRPLTAILEDPPAERPPRHRYVATPRRPTRHGE